MRFLTSSACSDENRALAASGRALYWVVLKLCMELSLHSDAYK